MRLSALLLLLLSGCGSRTGMPFDDAQLSPLGATAVSSACLGTPGETVVLSKAAPFQPIAVDATHIYFSMTLSPDESPHVGLMRIPKAGGTPAPIFSGSVANMLLSGGYIVILRPAKDQAFELLRLPKSGGTPETLATGKGEPTSLALAPDGTVLLTTRYGQGSAGLWQWRPGEKLALASSLVGAVRVAASSEHAYVVHRGTTDENALTRVRRGDGATTMLHDDVLHSSSLALDGDELFSSASFRVDRFTLRPTSAERETLGKGVGALADLAVDASHVYFADVGVYHDDLPPPKPKDLPGSIRRVPRTGGDVELLSEEGRDVRSLAVDDCHVYWTSRRGLVRLRKP